MAAQGKPISISGFTGVDRHVDATMIAPTMSPSMVNVVCDRGTLRVRWGQKRLCPLTFPSSTAPRALFEFVDPTTGPTWITAAGSKLLSFTPGVNPSLIELGTDAIHATNPVRSLQFRNIGSNRQYFVDGEHPVQYWEPGAVTTSTLATFTITDTDMTISVNDSSGFAHYDKIIINPASATPLTCIVSSVVDPYTLDVVYVSGPTSGTMPAYVSVMLQPTLISLYDQVAPTVAPTVTSPDAVDTQTAQYWYTGGSTYSVAFTYLYAEGESALSPVMTVTTAGTDAKYADMVIALTSYSGLILPTGETPPAGVIGYKLYALGVNLGTGSQWILMDVVTGGTIGRVVNLVTNPAFGTYGTPTLTDWIKSGDVTAFALDETGPGQTGSAKMTVTGSQYISAILTQTFSVNPDQTFDLTVKVWHEAFTTPFHAWIGADVYCYLSDAATGDIFSTTQLVVAAEGSVMDITKTVSDTIPATCTRVTVTIKMDEHTGAPNIQTGLSHSVYLYLVDFESESITPGDTPYIELPPELVVLDPYVNVPPAGCVGMTEWRNRMIYWKGNIAYFSNVSDPTRCPQQTLASMSTTYGFYLEIGSAGDIVIGFTLQEIPYFLKRRGMWLVLGSDANDIQEPVEHDSEVGCISAESMVTIPGTGVVWLGLNHIWQFTGTNKPSQLGTADHTLLDQFTVAQKEKAFAVYDNDLSLYVITFPGDGDCAGASLYYHVPTGQWSQHENMPGACGLYSIYYSTPGSYFLDTVLHSEVGYVYQMHVETTIDTGLAVAAPIPWKWKSKVFMDSAHLVSLDAVLVLPAQENAAMRLTARQIGYGGVIEEATMTKDLSRQHWSWKPTQGAAPMYQIELLGSSKDYTEIVAITLSVSDGGER